MGTVHVDLTGVDSAAEVQQYLLASGKFVLDGTLLRLKGYAQDGEPALLGALCRFVDKPTSLQLLAAYYAQTGQRAKIPERELLLFRKHNLDFLAWRREQARVWLDLAPLEPPELSDLLVKNADGLYGMVPEDINRVLQHVCDYAIPRFDSETTTRALEVLVSGGEGLRGTMDEYEAIRRKKYLRLQQEREAEEELRLLQAAEQAEERDLITPVPIPVAPAAPAAKAVRRRRPRTPPQPTGPTVQEAEELRDDILALAEEGTEPSARLLTALKNEDVKEMVACALVANNPQLLYPELAAALCQRVLRPLPVAILTTHDDLRCKPYVEVTKYHNAGIALMYSSIVSRGGGDHLRILTDVLSRAVTAASLPTLTRKRPADPREQEPARKKRKTTDVVTQSTEGTFDDLQALAEDEVETILEKRFEHADYLMVRRFEQLAMRDYDGPDPADMWDNLAPMVLDVTADDRAWGLWLQMMRAEPDDEVEQYLFGLARGEYKCADPPPALMDRLVSELKWTRPSDPELVERLMQVRHDPPQARLHVGALPLAEVEMLACGAPIPLYVYRTPDALQLAIHHCRRVVHVCAEGLITMMPTLAYWPGATDAEGQPLAHVWGRPVGAEFSAQMGQFDLRPGKRDDVMMAAISYINRRALQQQLAHTSDGVLLEPSPVPGGYQTRDPSEGTRRADVVPHDDRPLEEYRRITDFRPLTILEWAAMEVQRFCVAGLTGFETQLQSVFTKQNIFCPLLTRKNLRYLLFRDGYADLQAPPVADEHGKLRPQFFPRGRAPLSPNERPVFVFDVNYAEMVQVDPATCRAALMHQLDDHGETDKPFTSVEIAMALDGAMLFPVQQGFETDNMYAGMAGVGKTERLRGWGPASWYPPEEVMVVDGLRSEKDTHALNDLGDYSLYVTEDPPETVFTLMGENIFKQLVTGGHMTLRQMHQNKKITHRASRPLCGASNKSFFGTAQFDLIRRHMECVYSKPINRGERGTLARLRSERLPYMLECLHCFFRLKAYLQEHNLALTDDDRFPMPYHYRQARQAVYEQCEPAVKWLLNGGTTHHVLSHEAGVGTMLEHLSQAYKLHVKFGRNERVVEPDWPRVLRLPSVEARGYKLSAVPKCPSCNGIRRPGLCCDAATADDPTLTVSVVVGLQLTAVHKDTGTRTERGVVLAQRRTLMERLSYMRSVEQKTHLELDRIKALRKSLEAQQAKEEAQRAKEEAEKTAARDQQRRAELNSASHEAAKQQAQMDESGLMTADGTAKG